MNLIIFVFILSSLQFSDFLLTEYGLSNNLVEEANPFMKKRIVRYLTIPLYFIIPLLLLYLTTFGYIGEIVSFICFSFLIIIYSYVVFDNYYIIKKEKNRKIKKLKKM